MIAVRFQIGIFDINRKALLEVNEGLVTTIDGKLALINIAETDKFDMDEFYVWNSVDEVVDLYVQTVHDGGGIIVENTRLDDGTNMIKANVEPLARRFNLLLKAQR